MPKVSIIIPVYNGDSYLKECLESCLTQDFRDLEIIAVNDGSTDNSWSIMNDFASKDSRISLLTGDNQGVVYARKKGIEQASGDYLFFLDSDDILPEYSVDTLYNKALETSADIVIGGFGYILDEVIKIVGIPVGNRSEKEPILDVLLDQGFYLWGKLYKKSFWKSIHIAVPSSMRVGEDMAEFSILLNNASSVMYIDIPVYLYRRHQGGVSVNTNTQLADQLYEASGYVEKYLSEFATTHPVKQKLYAFLLDHVYMLLLSNGDVKKYKENIALRFTRYWNWSIFNILFRSNKKRGILLAITRVCPELSVWFCKNIKYRKNKNQSYSIY